MFVYTLMLAISSLPSSKPTHMLSLCFFSLFGIHAEIRGHKVFRGPLSACSPIPVPTPPPIRERKRERENGDRERDKERGRMLRQDHKNRAMCYRDNKVPPLSTYNSTKSNVIKPPQSIKATNEHSCRNANDCACPVKDHGIQAWLCTKMCWKLPYIICPCIYCECMLQS